MLFGLTHSVIQEGAPRNSSETAEHVFQQLMTALEPNVATTLNDAISGSGIKDTFAQPIESSSILSSLANSYGKDQEMGLRFPLAMSLPI